jgi:hypothetical protein
MYDGTEEAECNAATLLAEETKQDLAVHGNDMNMVSVTGR